MYISIQYNPRLNADVTSEIIKNYKYKLSDKNKNAIIGVINMLDKYHFLDGLDYSGGEERTKIYGLKKINDTRNEIIEAINNGNFNEAYKKTQEHHEHVKNMKEVYKFAKSVFPQDGSHIPGNVSCLRNEELPEELVTDVIVHSQVNGIFNFVRFCKGMKYDPINFINNPQKYQDIMTKKVYDGFLEKHSTNKNSSMKEKGMAISNLTQEYPFISIGENRAFESLMCLETDPELIRNNAISKEDNSSIVNKFGIYPGGLPFQRLVGNSTLADLKLVRDYLAGGDSYGIENFIPGGLNTITGEKYTSTFNYEEFSKNDNRSTIEKFTNVMDRLANGYYQSSILISEKNYEKSDGVNFNHFLIGCKSIFFRFISHGKCKRKSG